MKNGHERREVERRLHAAAEAERRRLVAEGVDPELERRAGAILERLMATAPADGARTPRRRLTVAAA